MGGDLSHHAPAGIKNIVVVRSTRVSDPETVSQVSYLGKNSVDLLVVLRGQVDSVLVPGGGQVAFQTLDLLGVFLKDREGPEIWCFSLCVTFSRLNPRTNTQFPAVSFLRRSLKGFC